jgi:hypothetical protein
MSLSLMERLVKCFQLVSKLLPGMESRKRKELIRYFILLVLLVLAVLALWPLVRKAVDKLRPIQKPAPSRLVIC